MTEIDTLAKKVFQAKRVIVVTGAGISVNSGIPDFRSEDGLYNLVKKQYPDVLCKGKDMFDASILQKAESASLFYTFIAKLKQLSDKAHPTPTHHFIDYLHSHGKLQRNYTQNIDSLELSSEKKLVQLHGNLRTLVCTLCKASQPFCQESTTQLATGTPIACPVCVAASDARSAAGRRAISCGSLRPAIVLYSEPHPAGDEIASTANFDLKRRPDLVLVMGTSLKVDGIKALVKTFCADVKDRGGHAILINKTRLTAVWDSVFTSIIIGDCDEVCVGVRQKVDDLMASKRRAPAKKATDKKIIFKAVKNEAVSKKPVLVEAVDNLDVLTVNKTSKELRSDDTNTAVKKDDQLKNADLKSEGKDVDADSDIKNVPTKTELLDEANVYLAVKIKDVKAIAVKSIVEKQGKEVKIKSSKLE